MKKKFLTISVCFLFSVFFLNSCIMENNETSELVVHNSCERQIYVLTSVKSRSAEPADTEYIKINSGAFHKFTSVEAEDCKIWVKEYNESKWNTESFDMLSSYTTIKIRWDEGKGGCYVVR